MNGQDERCIPSSRTRLRPFEVAVSSLWRETRVWTVVPAGGSRSLQPRGVHSSCRWYCDTLLESIKNTFQHIYTVKVKVKATARQFITSGLAVSDPTDDHLGPPPKFGDNVTKKRREHQKLMLRDGLEPES